MAFETFQPIAKLDETGLIKLNQILLEMVVSRSMNDSTDLIFDVTFGTAGTEAELTHSLGRIADRYFVIKKSVPCDVYNGSTTNTIEKTYLKCDTTGAVVKIIIF